MVNPDGVVLGNSRCSISGNDLNRIWRNPSENTHPEIFKLKNYIKNVKLKRDILVFCDMHGHSSKKNAFIYGCHSLYSHGHQIPGAPNWSSWT